MSEFSNATLLLNRYGIPLGVIVDGIRLPNVLTARVELKPGDLTRLIVEIGVSQVQTQREAEKP